MTFIQCHFYNRVSFLVTFHGGDVLDSALNYLDKYSPQILVLQVGILVIILSVFIWVWFYNRRKYHHLKHQIPASVVKSYLDSIIQNSTALKSSLFRGGGLDVDPNSIPSVMPLTELAGGASVGISSGPDGAELNALKAQISQLKMQLSEKQNTILDFEKQNTSLQGDVKAKQARIEELEKLLAEANSGGDKDAAAKILAITKERDALKETLSQYEVIEDDLANLKRLRQENEQLKKALADVGGVVPVIPTPTPAPKAEPVAAPEPEPVAEVPELAEEIEEPPMEDIIPDPEPEEEAPVEEPAAEVEEVVEAASDVEDDMPSPVGEIEEDKSPEDLLSEFEKMLG